MTIARLYATTLTSVVGAVARLYHAGVNGSASTPPTARLYHAGVNGSPGVVLAPFVNQTVEPGSTCTLTAVLQSGGTATYAWRVVQGTGVTLLGTGDTVTFVAPSGTPAATYPPSPATVKVAVTATVDGVASNEQVATITIQPQLAWAWTGTGHAGAPMAFQA